MAERQAVRGDSRPSALRALLWLGAVLALSLAFLGGLWALVRPFVADARALASIRRQALPDRRIEDGETGLVAELPPGWLALRAGNTLVTASEARLRLAQPSIGAFATVVVSAQPGFVGDLDGHIDALLRGRLARQPTLREDRRADVQLGRGRGRLVRTLFEDGLAQLQGATVAWADGYQIFSLEAWAPVEAGPAFAAEVEALCGGLSASGLVETRLRQALDRLAIEVPELSEASLRLLIAEQMSQGRDVAGVPREALFLVSRGLEALGFEEKSELRAIYQQVWAPVPEADRARMGWLLDAIRADGVVAGADVQLLRDSVKAGVLALPPEQKARLQHLCGRALRRGLSQP